MSLVPSNINEAIKHLGGRTEEEVLRNINANPGDFNIDDIFNYGIKFKNEDLIIKGLLLKRPDADVYYDIIGVIIDNKFVKAIKIANKEHYLENFIEILVGRKTKENLTNFWLREILPLIKLKKPEYSNTLRNKSLEMWRALSALIRYKNAYGVELFLKYKICLPQDIAAALINAYLGNYGNIKQNPKSVIRIIKLAKFVPKRIDQDSYRNPNFSGKEEDRYNYRDKIDKTKGEYHYAPNRRHIKAIINLMQVGEFDEKAIQPFKKILFGSHTTTVGKLKKILNKFKDDHHIVINFDKDESSFGNSNDYQQITDFELIKDKSGDLLNIKTTRFNR